MKCVFFLAGLLIIEVFASSVLCNENKTRKQVCEPDKGLNNVEVKEEWFSQYLNHFSPADRRKWQQRYFTNGEYYKLGGPVFLMVGGEAEADVEWMTNGAWIDYAKRFGALCVMLEHRYYGKSRPTEDTSIHNLQYLTVEQALADLAMFIVAINEKFGLAADIKWIAFGGSYPGALAAWLRLKYPHLVHGVVSSSGVLLFNVDYSVIAEDLKTHSDECENVVREGTLEVGVLLQHKEGNQALNERFHLCEPVENSVNNEKDIAVLYLTLAFNFGFIQLHKVNFSFLPHDYGAPNITIDMVCDILTNKSNGSPVERLADVNTLMLRLNNLTCLEYNYEKLIDLGKNTSWDLPDPQFALVASDRRWFYLLCTGSTDFQTSSFERETFGNKFPVEFYIQMCMDTFGPEYNATFIRNMEHWMNTTYDGLDFNTTNVLFVHGSLDPWHPGGITRNISHGPSAIFIEGTAHIADMVPETNDDLPQLKAARKQIAEYIDTWLQQ